MPRKAISRIERDSPQTRKGVVGEEAAGRRVVVTDPAPLRRSEGVLVEQRRDFSVEGTVEVGPRTDFSVLRRGAARQSVLALRGGEASIWRVHSAGAGADHRIVARRRRGDRRGVRHLATARNLGTGLLILSQTRI